MSASSELQQLDSEDDSDVEEDDSVSLLSSSAEVSHLRWDNYHFRRIRPKLCFYCGRPSTGASSSTNDFRGIVVQTRLLSTEPGRHDGTMVSHFARAAKLKRASLYLFGIFSLPTS